MLLVIFNVERKKTYNLYKRVGVIQYTSKFLLSGRVYTGIGIGIMQLSTWSLTMWAVATQTTGAGRFRNLTASILQHDLINELMSRNNFGHQLWLCKSRFRVQHEEKSRNLEKRT